MTFPPTPPFPPVCLGRALTSRKPIIQQFYNVTTDCLEASTEIVRFNRDTSAKSWQSDQLARRGKMDATGGAGAGAGAALGPVVEHVAFSSDGKVCHGMKRCLCCVGGVRVWE